MTDSSGIAAGDISVSKAVFIALLVIQTVSFYNVLELFFLLPVTFKRYNGVYFWSMAVSSLGCCLHGLGFLMKFFQLTTINYLSVTIITIGWYSMVTGQAIVLYSRLYLVELNASLRRRVLYMIVADAILFHIPTTVFTYGSNSSPQEAKHFIPGYKIMEKIQMTAFCMQEFLISGIYIRATWRRLPGLYDKGRKRILLHLFVVNVIIIFLDLGLLSVEYIGLYSIEVLLKSAVYTIKLKLELSILGRLVELLRPIDRKYREGSTADRERFQSLGTECPAVLLSPIRGSDEICDEVAQAELERQVKVTTDMATSWIEDANKDSEGAPRSVRLCTYHPDITGKPDLASADHVG